MVVAISVPRRDYAAALIGSGWMLASPAPDLVPPIEVFRAAAPGTCVRGVTDNRVHVGSLAWLREEGKEPRAHIADKTIPVARYVAAVELDGRVPSAHSVLPEPGFLGQLTGASATWAQRMAAPPTDLVLIGTAKWLVEDLDACIGNAADSTDVPCSLANYVLPIVDGVATWSTPVVSAPKLAEQPHLVESQHAAVLDGYGAIKYLNEIPTSIVVCVVDRSVADESAAETIMEARSANSRPMMLKDDLHWQPPVGIEALAFTVAR